MIPQNDKTGFFDQFYFTPRIDDITPIGLLESDDVSARLLSDVQVSDRFALARFRHFSITQFLEFYVRFVLPRDERKELSGAGFGDSLIPSLR